MHTVVVGVAVAVAAVVGSLHKDSGRIAAAERKVVLGTLACCALADAAVGRRQAGYYSRIGNSSLGRLIIG